MLKKKCCTTVFRMDCQQGPNITHGTLPMFCGGLDGGEFKGEWVYGYVWLNPLPFTPNCHNTINQLPYPNTKKFLKTTK